MPSSLMGELVTETFDYDGGRQVTVLRRRHIGAVLFLENATRWAGALRDAGADVVMTERVGSHGDAFWSEEFPLMAAWAFGQ